MATSVPEQTDGEARDTGDLGRRGRTLVSGTRRGSAAGIHKQKPVKRKMCRLVHTCMLRTIEKREGNPRRSGQEVIH